MFKIRFFAYVLLISSCFPVFAQSNDKTLNDIIQALGGLEQFKALPIITENTIKQSGKNVITPDLMQQISAPIVKGSLNKKPFISVLWMKKSDKNKPMLYVDTFFKFNNAWYVGINTKTGYKDGELFGKTGTLVDDTVVKNLEKFIKEKKIESAHYVNFKELEQYNNKMAAILPDFENTDYTDQSDDDSWLFAEKSETDATEVDINHDSEESIVKNETVVLNDTVITQPIANVTVTEQPIVNITTPELAVKNETVTLNDTVTTQPTTSVTVTEQPIVNVTTPELAVKNETVALNNTVTTQPIANVTVTEQPIVNVTTPELAVKNETVVLNNTVTTQPIANATVIEQPIVNVTTPELTVKNETVALNNTATAQPIVNVTVTEQPVVNTTITEPAAKNETVTLNNAATAQSVVNSTEVEQAVNTTDSVIEKIKATLNFTEIAKTINSTISALVTNSTANGTDTNEVKPEAKNDDNAVKVEL